MSDPRADPTVLRSRSYADSGNLNARRSLYAFREGPFVLVPWVLGQVAWPAPGLVLDVGCGPGQYLAAIDEIGVGCDLSLGMVREAVAATGGLGVQADVAALPVAAGRVGRVLAPHMLYHASDPEAALAELRRVLAPGGDVVIVLNGADHLHELRREVEAAADADLGWERLLLDDAVPLVETVFEHVEVVRADGRLLVTDPEAVAAYVASSEALHASAARRPWSEVVDRLRAWAAAEIAAHGQVVIHTQVGVIVAR